MQFLNFKFYLPLINRRGLSDPWVVPSHSFFRHDLKDVKSNSNRFITPKTLPHIIVNSHAFFLPLELVPLPLHCCIQSKQCSVCRVYPEQQRNAERRLIFQYDMSLPKSTSHYIIFYIRCSVSRHENYLFNRFVLCLGTLDHNSQLKHVCDRPVPFRCFKLKSLTQTTKF
jgi:hypothetical protein